MAIKFAVAFALFAVACAVPVEYHHQPAVYQHQPAVVYQQQQPHYSHGHVKAVEYENGPAEYDFSYAVHDEHTGDIKSQHETRHGDAVHGSYELIDADGHKRTVEYTADDHHGFNAVVHREPTNIKVPVHQVVAAPVAHYSHAAPVAHYSHAAPVAHYSHAAPVTHQYSHAAPVAHHYASAPVAHYTTSAHHQPSATYSHHGYNNYHH